MERSTIFKNGKPSLSMGHGFHGYETNNQRVIYLQLYIYNVSKIGDFIPSTISYELCHYSSPSYEFTNFVNEIIWNILLKFTMKHPMKFKVFFIAVV